MRCFHPGFVTRPPLLAIWSSSDKSSNIFLSNGQTEAEFTASTNGGVRCTLPRRTGKWYFEITASNNSANTAGYGLAAADTPFDFTSTHGFMQFITGSVEKDNNFLFGNGIINSGTTLRIAWDADNHLAWIAAGGGNFNADASADPATGVLGQLTAGFDSNGLFPYFTGNANTRHAALNTGATAFTYAVPSGFSAWNTA
jgi:hypothetical protein